MTQRIKSVPELDEVEVKRFWEKVKIGQEDECWPWLAAKSKLGYGKFKIRGKLHYAHRVAFAISNMASPSLIVCHQCDNPECVNPKHLWNQTFKENSQDGVDRNRWRAETVLPHPGKPYADYPLTPHPSGRWCKKIRGKVHYFGKLSDGWKPALDLYLRIRDQLQAGMPVIESPDGPTIHDVCRRFLQFKRDRRNAGGLSAHLFDEYGAVCRRLIEAVGRERLVVNINPTDFAAIRRAMTEDRCWGVYRVLNEITRIKSIFKFAAEEGIIARPPIYGQAFKPPTKKDIRVHRAAAGSRAFTAEEIRGVLEIAEQPMRAMILLAMNAALSNSDIANLPAGAVDLAGGWLDFARVKTGIARRVPLWAETVDAVREWCAIRPAPVSEDDAGLVFVTKYGRDWRRKKNDSPVTKEFAKLLAAKKITGRSFYGLRRTFQNVGEERTKDFLAVRAIMGHATADISEFYREKVSDQRLTAVTEAVREWLFAHSLTI